MSCLSPKPRRIRLSLVVSSLVVSILGYTAALWAADSGKEAEEAHNEIQATIHNSREMNPDQAKTAGEEAADKTHHDVLSDEEATAAQLHKDVLDESKGNTNKLHPEQGY